MVFVFNVVGLALVGVAIFLSAGAYTSFGPLGLWLGPIVAIGGDLYWRATHRDAEGTGAGVMALLGPRSGGHLFFVPIWVLGGAGLAYVASIGLSAGPSKITVEGTRYEREGSWSVTKDIHSDLYMRNGASVQLGLLYGATSRVGSPDELHAWVMREYRSATEEQWFTQDQGTAACKVGRHKGRTFVAVDVCETRGGKTGCAELDEERPFTCGKSDGPCRENTGRDACIGAIADKQATLQAALTAVLGS